MSNQEVNNERRDFVRNLGVATVVGATGMAVLGSRTAEAQSPSTPPYAHTKSTVASADIAIIDTSINGMVIINGSPHSYEPWRIEQAHFAPDVPLIVMTGYLFYEGESGTTTEGSASGINIERSVHITGDATIYVHTERKDVLGDPNPIKVPAMFKINADNVTISDLIFEKKYLLSSERPNPSLSELTRGVYHGKDSPDEEDLDEHNDNPEMFYSPEAYNEADRPKAIHKNLTLRNCIFDGMRVNISPDSGVLFDTSILGCTFKNTYNADRVLHINGAKRTRVIGCHFYEHYKSHHENHGRYGRVISIGNYRVNDNNFLEDLKNNAPQLMIEDSSGIVYDPEAYGTHIDPADDSDRMLYASHTIVKDCVIHDCADAAIGSGGSLGITIVNNIIYNCGTGMNLKNYNGGNLDGNMNNAIKGESKYHIVVNNQVYDNGSNGIIAMVESSIISDNISRNNSQGWHTTDSDGELTEVTKGLSIKTGNHFDDNNIALAISQNLIISGNLCSEDTWGITARGKHLMIVDNIIHDSVEDGVEVGYPPPPDDSYDDSYGETSQIQINMNQIYDNGGENIKVNSGSTIELYQSHNLT